MSAALALAARQQDVVRALLRGEELTDDDLVVLAAPLPSLDLDGPADVEALRVLEAGALALELVLAQRMKDVQERTLSAGAAPRYLDARC